MRFTVKRRDHDEYIERYTPALAGRLDDYIGECVPLRIGEIVYGATLCAVELDGAGEVVLEFDLVDSDLRWEALLQPYRIRNGVPVP